MSTEWQRAVWNADEKRRSCLELWWVMTGYGKPIWFNVCVLLYSWEKGQIPCALGWGVMKVGAAHLSRYLKRARWLMLPAGTQTRPGDGYCATGWLLFPMPISGDSEILFYPVSERRVQTWLLFTARQTKAYTIAYCCQDGVVKSVSQFLLGSYSLVWMRWMKESVPPKHLRGALERADWLSSAHLCQ